MTVSDILAEIGSGKPIMPERAKWFREMLGNAIANCEDGIRFFGTYERSRSTASQYSSAEVEDIIQHKRDRIATYRDALYALESGFAHYVEMTWADAMTWAEHNKVRLGGTEEADFAATQDMRKFHKLPLIRLIDQRGKRARMPHPCVGGIAGNPYAKATVYHHEKEPRRRQPRKLAHEKQASADAALSAAVEADGVRG